MVAGKKVGERRKWKAERENRERVGAMEIELSEHYI